MKADGVWDATREALGENTLDAEVHAMVSSFINKQQQEKTNG